jgi:predicted transcriptional regulator
MSKKQNRAQFSELIRDFFVAHPEIKRSGLAKIAGVDRITLWRVMNGTEPTQATRDKISEAISRCWRIDFDRGNR